MMKSLMDVFYGDFWKNKVSLQTSLEINSTNFSCISILSVNFKNLTVRLHVKISSNKC